MTTWRVTYGPPYPGTRDFTDHAQAHAFATSAHTTTPATITTIPAATGDTK